MMSAPVRDEKNVSWKIGRYEGVCLLATGGMAEILLARQRGPSGFQRPVVIKRILPHLARGRDFVDMFLDEARIVAGVRHPNVVHVHELGHEDGELYLVMEYLEGEAVSVIVPRLRKRQEHLDYALCAHIGAEACAGLHAAHELVDEAGNPLNVVHRDISPQNIFVTYSGAVKLLDFGIATAEDRQSKTETGQFKGKLQYSSPEQCVGLALDRRSDIFGLGVVLYELSTQTRLFKRASHMLTLRAICEGRIVPPTEIVPDFPPALSAIIMRALERRPKARYQTALEMRRELLAVARKLSSDVALEEALGEKMTELFPDRILEKAAMLRGAESGDVVKIVPPTETDIDIDVPLAFEDPQPTADALDHSESGFQRMLLDDEISAISGRTAPEPAKRRAWPMAALLLAGVVVGAVAAASAAAHFNSEPPATSQSVAADIPPVPVDSKPNASPDTTSTSTPSAQAALEQIVLDVETTPQNARVIIDGVDRGASPAKIELARSDAKIRVQLRRDGYRPLDQTVVPNVDQKLVLTLVPAGAKRSNDAPKSTGSPYQRFE